MFEALKTVISNLVEDAGTRLDNQDGRLDKVVIELPKPGYVPVFRLKEQPGAQPAQNQTYPNLGTVPTQAPTTSTTSPSFPMTGGPTSGLGFPSTGTPSTGMPSGTSGIPRLFGHFFSPS